MLRGFRIIGERTLRIVPSELRAGIDKFRFQSEDGEPFECDRDVTKLRRRRHGAFLHAAIHSARRL